MWNGYSQLGFKFPYFVIKTTCLNHKSPSWIFLGIIVEFYLLFSLFLAENSRMWAMSLTSSIKSTMHSRPASFTSCLNWEWRYEGVLMWTRIIVSNPYTMVNGASLVVEWGMIWYDHYISWSKLAHNPLALFNFFLITFKITLFAEFACTLDDGCKTETKFVCTPNLGKKIQWPWCCRIMFYCQRRWRLTAWICTWFSTSRNKEIYLL